MKTIGFTFKAVVVGILCILVLVPFVVIAISGSGEAWGLLEGFGAIGDLIGTLFGESTTPKSSGPGQHLRK